MDELEKSMPEAEALVEAEQNTVLKRHNDNCLNCGTPLTDVFCPHCGQKDLPRRQTLRELFENFISSFWSYEGKFFRTTKYLITKPGFLAKEYNAGKRESFYHPARMYVFISFIFFFLFFNIENDEQDEIIELDRSDIEQLKNDFDNPGVDSLLNRLLRNPDNLDEWVITQKTMDSLDLVIARKVDRGPGFSISRSEYKSVEQYDSAQLTLPEAKRDGWFNRKMEIRSIELNQRFRRNQENMGEAIGKALLENSSKVVFFLLPVFALLLKLLYVRRGFYYSEHLVFSIYYYNFVYFAGSVQLLLGLVPWLSWLSTIVGFWIVFYALFAMKKVYAQGWGKTIAKFMILYLLFILCMSIAFAISFFWILLMI
jgi:Protein of unknown function (DUF3667)